MPTQYQILDAFQAHFDHVLATDPRSLMATDSLSRGIRCQIIGNMEFDRVKSFKDFALLIMEIQGLDESIN